LGKDLYSTNNGLIR